MTDWSDVVVPALPALEPFHTGPSVSELAARYGVDEILQLDWNENLFGPLPGVVEAARDELANVWMYPEEGYLGFQSDVAEALGTAPSRIVPAHGTQALIGTVASAFLRPGDGVVVPESTFGLYALVSATRGATVHRVPLRDHGLDLERLAETAARTGARLVWVCDPNNPTGGVLAREEWDLFLDALPVACVAVVDEAYVDYLPLERRLGRERDVEAGRAVVVLRSFSKFYGLAGLRLGYAVADESLAGYLALVEEPFNVNCVALAAGRASLHAVEAAAERRREVAGAREALAEGLRAAGVDPLPSEANFVLARVGVDDVRLVEALARRGILVRAGTELGLPGFVRIAVGPRPLMERLTAEIAELVAAGGR